MNTWNRNYVDELHRKTELKMTVSPQMRANLIDIAAFIPWLEGGRATSPTPPPPPPQKKKSKTLTPLNFVWARFLLIG